MVADAPRRRRRKHADPLRRLPRRGAARALALCHRAPVHRRRARRRAAQPARAARLRLRGPRRLDRLLHRAPARARVAGRWRSATSATRCSRSARAPRPGWRSATTTRARSAPTGSSTRSRSASASAAPRCASTSAPRRPSTSSPREGEYLGGALMTGIEISLEALSERGARLPKVDLAPPRSVIGKNTIDAIRSGVVYGYAGRDRRDPAPPLRRARRAHRRDRHRRARAARRALHRGDRARSTTCSRSPGCACCTSATA